MNAAEEQVIGEWRAGRELLRTLQDNASVALADHTGTQRRVCLRMGWLAAVDLRRREGVGDVEMVVARVLVECHQVVGITLPGSREECRIGGETREKSDDMIGCSPHQAEGVLGPALDHAAPRTQVLRPLRNMIAPKHGLAGSRRPVGHQVAVGGIGGDVPKAGDRLGCATKGRVGRYVLDHVAVVDDLTSIVTD